MNLNLAIEKIIKLGKKDQKLRFKFLSKKKKGLDPSFDEIFKFDILSTNFLIKVVEKFGIPTNPVFGYKACDYAFLIVQHSSNLEFQKKYLELLKSQPKKNITLKHIAYLEDRVNMYEDKPQKYGTQYIFDIKFGKNVPYKLLDTNKVEEYRKEMGLETLESYSKKFN